MGCHEFLGCVALVLGAITVLGVNLVLADHSKFTKAFKSLGDVGVCFSRTFEEANISVLFGEVLSFLGRNLSIFLQITLVADYKEGEGVWVLRRGLLQENLSPVVQVLER